VSERNISFYPKFLNTESISTGNYAQRNTDTGISAGTADPVPVHQMYVPSPFNAAFENDCSSYEFNFQIIIYRTNTGTGMKDTSAVNKNWNLLSFYKDLATEMPLYSSKKPISSSFQSPIGAGTRFIFKLNPPHTKLIPSHFRIASLF
jgi:hypothetical protein